MCACTETTEFNSLCPFPRSMQKHTLYLHIFAVRDQFNVLCVPFEWEQLNSVIWVNQWLNVALECVSNSIIWFMNQNQKRLIRTSIVMPIVMRCVIHFGYCAYHKTKYDNCWQFPSTGLSGYLSHSHTYSRTWQQTKKYISVIICIKPVAIQKLFAFYVPRSHQF